MEISLADLVMRYEPFPIGIARPSMSADRYEALLESYPPASLFAYFPKVGHKYCLSEKFNGAAYRDWIEGHAAWRDLHRWIKSEAFVRTVLDALADRHVDLGMRPRSTAVSLRKGLKGLLTGRGWRRGPSLRARFEFSMLPAAGGCVIPHTDNPEKIVTLVLSMVRAGEWDQAHGGGTEVCRHLRPERSFNRMNAKAAFDDMEELQTYAFQPNQCVLFVKTFNSWHCVRPMRGPGTAMRRSITINIETGR